MPIYEYKCENCSAFFSHLHKRLNEPVPNCPECNSDKVKKQLSSFSAGSSTSSSSSCSLSGSCPAPSMGSCPGGACPLM